MLLMYVGGECRRYKYGEGDGNVRGGVSAEGISRGKVKGLSRGGGG